jgi:hypothetical protein
MPVPASGKTLKLEFNKNQSLGEFGVSAFIFTSRASPTSALERPQTTHPSGASVQVPRYQVPPLAPAVFPIESTVVTPPRGPRRCPQKLSQGPHCGPFRFPQLSQGPQSGPFGGAQLNPHCGAAPGPTQVSGSYCCPQSGAFRGPHLQASPCSSPNRNHRRGTLRGPHRCSPKSSQGPLGGPFGVP